MKLSLLQSRKRILKLPRFFSLACDKVAGGGWGEGDFISKYRARAGAINASSPRPSPPLRGGEGGALFAISRRRRAVYQSCPALQLTLILVTCCFMTIALNLSAANSFPEVSQLPPHPEIPDPLVLLNGKPVTTKAQWFEERRPELKAL